MKKSILTLIALSIAIISQAAQLAFLPKEKAYKSLLYIKNNNITEMLLLDACQGTKPVKLGIDKVVSDYTGTQNFFQICVITKSFEYKKLDLAYVFVKSESETWVNLGKLLGFECFPCIEDGFTVDDKGNLQGATLVKTNDD